MIDAVLLRPLPGIAKPERLASLYHTNELDSKAFSPLSWPDFAYFQSTTRSFSGLLAYLRLPFAVRVGDRMENMPGELVSDEYFRVLGVQPLRGRDFDPREGDPVVMLGERVWRDRFGADPNLIGRAIQIAGKPLALLVQAGLFLRTFRNAAESDAFLRSGNCSYAGLSSFIRSRYAPRPGLRGHGHRRTARCGRSE